MTDWHSAAKAIGERAAAIGERVYIVGGAVRNELLNLPTSDVDLASALTPAQVREVFCGEGVNVIPVAEEFGTMLLRVGECKFEHTTFRKDSYTGHAHRPDEVLFTNAITEDAFRRDFTVNALYRDSITGELIDPTGGLADLERRVLRTTRKNPDETLAEDALRMLRLVRFACELGFSIDMETANSVRRNVSGLREIAKERIYIEWKKMVLSDATYDLPRRLPPHGRALTLLTKLRLLPELLPELAECANVPLTDSLDVKTYLEAAFAAGPPSLPLRMAALLHGVCAPGLNGAPLANGYKLSAKMAKAALLRLGMPPKVCVRVQQLIENLSFGVTDQPTDAEVRRQLALWGEDFAEDIAAVHAAIAVAWPDVHGEAAKRFPIILKQMRDENAPFSENRLNVTGTDIAQELGLSPGQIIGRIKRELFLHCAVYPEDNERERLLDLAAAMREEL